MGPYYKGLLLFAVV